MKARGEEGGEAARRMNESHDSHVFCFAYSAHRLIRHALLAHAVPARNAKLARMLLRYYEFSKHLWAYLRFIR